MPLKDLNTLPPSGWQFDQKDDNGKVVKSNWMHRHSPFTDFCQEVLRMRTANNYARATLPQVREEVDEFQCQRLGYDPNFVKKKPVSFQPTRLFSPQHLRETVQAVANRIGNLSDGAHILTRWVGDGGKPVEPAVAQTRADVCTGRLSGVACPHNQSGFAPVERIAEIIHNQTEKKNELKLRVEGEENLNTCSLCFCALHLKVHVPLDHILSGTPAPMLEKFKREKPDCWLVTEAEKLNPSKQ